MNLFRYRDFNEDILKVLENGYLSATIFKQYTYGTELDIDISDDLLSKYNMSKDEASRIIHLYKEHINKSYYLCCLSKIAGYRYNKMWEDFGGNNTGFCIVYDYEEILEQLTRSDKYSVFKKVIYSDTKATLNELIDYMANESRGRKYFENDKVDEAVINAPKSVFNCIVQCSTTKPNKNINEKEYRLVCFYNKNNFSDYINDLLKIKPKQIIISKKANISRKNRLIKYRNANNIPFVLCEDN